MDHARGTVEAVARDSYSRLVSYLSARSGDVAAAEDALADAFVSALRTWPVAGVPLKPEAWLLAAARHRLIDRARHERVRVAALDAIRHVVDEAAEMSAWNIFPDERLKLLFVCAHPAIDASVHTPLMLQVVLGLDAATIASAFVTLPATMAQRLVRAKTKIRDTAIAFDVPGGDELGPRLGAVLEAIYAAYGAGWDDVVGDPRRRGLTDEAIWLARVLLQLVPEEPEARGLLALMLYCEARRPARRNRDGAYVPISEQDTSLWSAALIDEAERTLRGAARRNSPGRFQLEAALQSAHVGRARSGHVDWRAIALLYEGVVRAAPTLGARVGRAAALGEADGATAGLADLDGLSPDNVSAYQPYWAVRAHLLHRLGRRSEARDAYDRAIDLAEDDAIRRFLLQRRSDLV